MSNSTAPANPQSARRKWLPILAILTAVAIWGLQFVMIRLGLLTELTGFDLATLRFGIAGPLMLPLFIKFGWRDCAGLGWRDGIMLACLAGLPMAVFSNWGMNFAPANHAACLQPGTVAVVTAIAGGIMARTGLPPITIIGTITTILGLVAVAFGAPAAVAGPQAWIGDIVFVLSGLCWAVYTIILARRKFAPLASTVVVGVLSMAMTPLLIAFFPSKLATASWSAIVMHGLFQGIVNYTLAFGLWAYAARELGPVRLGMFAPLIPVFGVLIGMPVLNEFPTGVQWAGIAAVILGLLIINSFGLIRSKT